MGSLPRLYEDEADPSLEEAIAFLRRTLAEPIPSGRDVLVVCLEAPSEALEKFLRLVPREMGFMWRSPSGMRIAAGGDLIAIEASGEDRLSVLKEKAARVWPRLHVVSQTGAPIEPILFGGIAFAPSVPPLSPWEEFTTDAFSLARWTYRRVGDDSAYLSVALHAEECRDPACVDAIVGDARRILYALLTESPTSLIHHHDIQSSALRLGSLGDWCSHVTSILTAIRSGAFQKIVAARRCIVDLERAIEDTGFMARLFAAYPDCNQFALRRAHSTFLGATPETLFRKTGDELTTHALAGTARASDDPRSDSSAESAALRRSVKDLAEHALVVKRICDELWPISQRLRYSTSPQARQVRDLVHLQTPISADLKPGVEVFDVLSRFHPTPAVGGFPAREAARWIRENEPIERGWYTGAVGWFDAAGNAEFAVAIRCGVLTEKKAYIFAGAGIVGRSDPEAEWAETRAKMHPLLRALGVSV